MRKCICILTALVCMLPLCLLPTGATAAFEMEIPYGHPTVDGVIEEGEYSVTYVMNALSAEAWVGQVAGSSVTWHLAWDENGLYYAGTINDTTPTYRDDNGHWVGIDCLELAVNPGELLPGDDRTEGIFFSFGSKADGGVVAFRHNFEDGLVTAQITGAATGHVEGTESYTMEVFIPWELVQIKAKCTVAGKQDIRINSTGWEPTTGAVLGLLPCAIDAQAGYKQDNGILAAYKFTGTDFVVKDFIHATLAGGPVEETTVEETTAEETTVEETPAEETTVEETAAEETTVEVTTVEETTLPETNAEETTATDTSADGTPEAESTTAETATTTETEAAAGCASSVTLSSVAGAWTVCLAALALRKKKEE